MNWWGDIFGFAASPTSGTGSESSDPNWGIPVVPKVSGKEPLEKAVEDFLKTWLVDNDTRQAMAYFSRESFDCVMAFEGEAETNDFAPIRIFHEMEFIGELVGSRKPLRGLCCGQRHRLPN